MKRIDLYLLGGVLALALAACVPVTYAPNTTLVFSASYDELFDAILQALTTTYVARPSTGNYAFVVTSADRDSGLITAERLTRSTGRFVVTESFSRRGSPFRLRLSLPVRPTPSERTLLSVVVQPVDANHTAFSYSSTPALNGKSNDFNLYLLKVIAGLEAQFAQTTLLPR